MEYLVINEVSISISIVASIVPLTLMYFLAGLVSDWK